MTREVFITHVEREQEALRGFLLALCCGNKGDADDLAQDTLVKAYLSLAGYQDKGKFRSWLFKIAHNTFLNHKASCRTMESIDEARLPPKERSAITLFYLNGYSIKEIAAITDTTEGAVKQQLSRGRDKLKEKIRAS